MKSIDNLFAKIGSYHWRGDSDMADFDALVEAVQDEIRESYIKLPLDADEVPIRVGDEVYQVEGGWVYTVKSITFYPDNTTVSFECKHGFGCDNAHNVHHYHEPTVEMLSEYPKKWGGGLHWGVQLEGEQAPTAFDVFLRHHHKPTVEDLLREFA